jgi:hypothetical protein
MRSKPEHNILRECGDRGDAEPSQTGDLESKVGGASIDLQKMPVDFF